MRTAEPRGPILWAPSEERKRQAELTRYLSWLEEHKGLSFDTYQSLWEWSVFDLSGFWESIWDYMPGTPARPNGPTLAEPRMPGARWFSEARLNYAEHALFRRDEHLAVMFGSERGDRQELSYRELARLVASVRAGLEGLGVRRGDRVVAYAPNIPETLIAFLAVASMGAIWSSCSPDFGIPSVIDRFKQIEPKVLIAVDGYTYAGRGFDRRETVQEIRANLPTLEAVVSIPYGEALFGSLPSGTYPWEELLVEDTGDPRFDPVSFDHPLYILYSSGTTGVPKPIVHGHGGILLEHLKVHRLHLDLGSEDRFFWFTTTGWMMWNFLVSGLLPGSTIVLYDGSPAHPDLSALWRFAEETGITYFGTSASYIQSCMKAGIRPKEYGLSRLRSVGSTGAPLAPEGFAWVYDNVSQDVLLGSVSGGTDMCTAFVGSCPLLPVRAGEIQCRCLGAAVHAFDDVGNPVVDQVGELVLTRPMPSMPLNLWNDPDGTRYRDAYFGMYPGVWRHGDWVRIFPDGACIIYGRSDSTLNRGGVRMGTAEFYRVVEDLPEIQETLVLDTGSLGREGQLILLVVMASGYTLDSELEAKLREKIRRDLSPRHVPDRIVAIPEVPRTLSGKKLEVPIRRLLLGTPLDQAVSLDGMSNPESVVAIADLLGSRVE